MKSRFVPQYPDDLWPDDISNRDYYGGWMQFDSGWQPSGALALAVRGLRRALYSRP